MVGNRKPRADYGPMDKQKPRADYGSPLNLLLIKKKKCYLTHAYQTSDKLCVLPVFSLCFESYGESYILEFFSYLGIRSN